MNEPIHYRNKNQLWAYAILQEVAQSPIQHACITPGSRNTPLMTAASYNDSIQTISLLDERSAGFFSLGLAKETDKPVMLISTSGTATGEFHPAIMEASEGLIPLLIATADRPPELSNSGANQTTNQRELYGSSVRMFREISEPELQPRKIRSLRTNIQRAINRTTQTKPGPVHLNIPFRKPLEPTSHETQKVSEFVKNNPLESEGRVEQPFVRIECGERTVKETSISLLANYVRKSDRPVIQVGPLPQSNDVLNNLKNFSRSRSIPVFADPLSHHCYQQNLTTFINHYELILPELPKSDLNHPDLFLRVGMAPNASNNLMDYLVDADAKQISIHNCENWNESEFQTELKITAPIDLTFGRLHETLDENHTYNRWINSWRQVDQRVNEKLQSHPLTSKISEPAIIDTVISDCNTPAKIFVGNSTPIRDLTQYCNRKRENIDFIANRGLSGIDGQISTIAGLAYKSDVNVIGVIGDISFYHDMNALLTLDKLDLQVIIIVINNDGGGIFHRLPVEQFDPPFTDLLKTPHGLSFEKIADQFNLNYSKPKNLGNFKQTLQEARNNDQSSASIVEIQTDARKNQRTRENFESTLSDLFENER